MKLSGNEAAFLHGCGKLYAIRAFCRNDIAVIRLRVIGVNVIKIGLFTHSGPKRGVRMNGVNLVKANVGTHKAFGDALDAAIEAGVKVLMLPCFVDSTSIFIVEKNK